MLIGGFQKFSLLDYPGKISAIIFTKGCNFRCQFCYNPMLVGSPSRGEGKSQNNSSQLNEEKKDYPLIKEDDLFCFLKKRSGKLDAVVITGGEPTMHNDLLEFIKKIKKFGYLIKIDTNGTNPEMLKKLIKQRLIDYIAMDLKGSKKRYAEITGVKIDFNKIKKSVKIIMSSGIDYEFRTTIVPDFFDKDDVKEIGQIILGADKWFLQKFKNNMDLINNNLRKKKAFADKKMQEMCKIGRKFVKKCEMR